MTTRRAQPWEVIYCLASLEYGSGNEVSAHAFRELLKRNQRERLIALGVVVRITGVDPTAAAIALGIVNTKGVVQSFKRKPPPADQVREYCTLIYAMFARVRARQERAELREALK